MGHSLLVVGSIAIDSVTTPHGQVDEVLGGSAVYFSVASSFFVPVRLVGVVGEDFPDAFRQVLECRSIDTAGLQCVAGGRTFRWKGSYAGAMNEAVTEDVQLNVFGDFKPVIPDGWRDSDLVFLANGSPVTQAAVLDQVTRPRLVVADTMNLWINTQLESLKALLRRIDGLVLNDGEARMLAGDQNLVSAGRKILEMGPRFVVIKKGEHGALLTSRGDPGPDGEAPYLVCVLPAFPSLRVHDPTGAGDTFAGGMMGYLASQGAYDFHTLIRAMAYGTVTASFTIEDFSLRRLERLVLNEIDERLVEYHQMLHF